MKSIAGAILLLANAIFVQTLIAHYPRQHIFGNPDGYPTVLFWLIVIHSLLGIYFLFFAKDKPAS